MASSDKDKTGAILEGAGSIIKKVFGKKTPDYKNTDVPNMPNSQQMNVVPMSQYKQKYGLDE